MSKVALHGCSDGWLWLSVILMLKRKQLDFLYFVLQTYPTIFWGHNCGLFISLAIMRDVVITCIELWMVVKVLESDVRAANDVVLYTMLRSISLKDMASSYFKPPVFPVQNVEMTVFSDSTLSCGCRYTLTLDQKSMFLILNLPHIQYAPSTELHIQWLSSFLSVIPSVWTSFCLRMYVTLKSFLDETLDVFKESDCPLFKLTTLPQPDLHRHTWSNAAVPLNIH